MVKSNRKRPLYDQLVDLLKGKIENEFEPDSLLPSERELVDQYGVSRTTVRQALQELEQMNYIYRRHGKGTFVSDLRNHATNLSGAYSFTDQ
ncbi:MAG: GntR family transcriptional regulator, partial [Lactococcus raffinolactis]